jgi:predicted MPP superfamily phosphohydrolase
MMLRWIIFVSIMTAVLSLMVWYIGRQLIARSDWMASHRGVVWFALFLFVALQILGPMLYRTLPTPGTIHFVFQWITYITLGVFACMFFYALVGDVFARVLKWILSDSDGIVIERRSFLGAMIATAASAGIGVAQAIQGPKVEEIDVPIQDLPKDLEGFRIAQISDLHLGPTINRKYCENVVAITNSLNADLIALTGDFVDGTPEGLRDATEPLSRLKSKHGSYFITGNHEYYWGAKIWSEEFRRLGAKVLENSHDLLKIGESTLAVCGITDKSGGQFFPDHQSDPAKACARVPSGAVKLLLAHHPGSYADARNLGYVLQISGHTHAGQFFPWSLFVPLAHKYYRGLNLDPSGMWVYVNKGTGYWGPPMRFAVPSEISLIRLTRA